MGHPESSHGEPFAGVAIPLAGVRVMLLPSGALWIADTGTLVVSDLHLEKGSSFAVRGQMTPPYDTRDTLDRIDGLVRELRPRTLVSLGDSFHDRGARARMAPDDVARIRAMSASCDCIWIAGNHDPAPPADLGGATMSELTVGGLTFRHESSPGSQPGEISGHLHPCARVVGRGGSVRARCFATDGDRMVMPAFGALTGGLNVLDDAYRSVFPRGLSAFVIGRSGVYAAALNRLVPDRPAQDRTGLRGAF